MRTVRFAALAAVAAILSAACWVAYAFPSAITQRPTLLPETQQLELSGPQWVIDDPHGSFSAANAAAIAARGGGRAMKEARARLLRLAPDEVLWLVFEVAVDPQAPADWLLVAGTPTVDRVTVYVETGTGSWKGSTEIGAAVPFSHRALPQRSPTFEVKLARGGTSTILVRVRDGTATADSIPVTLWQPNALSASEFWMHAVYSFFLSEACALGLYNLLLFAVLRDRRYLFYVGYVAGGAFGILAHSGLGHEFFWGDFPWWNSHIVPVAENASLGFLALFTRQFFSTRERLPRVDRAFLAIAAVMLAGAAAGFLPWRQLAVLILTSVGLVLVVLNACLSVYATWRKWPGAAYFCAGSLALQTGLFVAGMRATLQIPHGVTVAMAVSCGAALELILFALALADRVNEERRQKERARSQTLAITQASQALASETRLDALYARTCGVVASLAGATVVHLILRDADIAQWFLYSGADGGRRVPVAEAGPDGQLALSAFRVAEASGKPLVIDNAADDPRFAAEPALEHIAVCSLLVVPVMHHGAPCAALVLENRDRRGAFDQVPLDTVETIAAPLAVSLENALLYERLEQRVAEQTQSLRQAQQDLLVMARRAGMAEIATNVLHNVGNALNSVNVAAGMMRARIASSKVAGLERAVELMESRSGDLAAFMENDARGKLLPNYLREVSREMRAEHEEQRHDLARLATSLDLAMNVLATQQAYARAPAFTEPIVPSSLMEDALRVASDATSLQNVEIVRHYEDTGTIRLDKGRTLQVLVNLVMNARQAMEESAARNLTLRIETADGRLRFGVRDSGCGIPAENLSRVFAHGFTTRRGGHGFGLHSCANAASEMGGTLTARSEGPGLGSTFTLELPLSPV